MQLEAVLQPTSTEIFACCPFLSLKWNALGKGGARLIIPLTYSNLNNVLRLMNIFVVAIVMLSDKDKTMLSFI